MSIFVASSGAHISYRDQGQGDALLFLHGWCMSARVWQHQEVLVADGMRLIMPDLPGHGDSSIAASGFSIKAVAGDIASLLDSVGCSRVHLVGWSLGAFVAFELYRQRPDVVAGLVLVSATPRFQRADDFPHGLSSQEVAGMALKVRRNVERAVIGFQTLLLAPDEAGSELSVPLLASQKLPTQDTVLQALEELARADERKFLEHIRCPVQIIHGNRDRICLPSAAVFLKDMIPAAKVSIFDGCGHIPFVTQYKTFNTVVRNFIRRSGGTED